MPAEILHIERYQRIFVASILKEEQNELVGLMLLLEWFFGFLAFFAELGHEAIGGFDLFRRTIHLGIGVYQLEQVTCRRAHSITMSGINDSG